MTTITLEISDAAIRRHATDPAVRELNDSRLPYRFRYDKKRLGGSWHIVKSIEGKPRWKKAGTFPALTTKGLKAALPAIMGRLYADPKNASASVGIYKVVNDVLVWFEARMAQDRNLSRKRKDTVRSAIKCHLRPMLGGFDLLELTRGNLDSQLLWPLQSRYSLAHVRLVWQVLKMISKRARSAGVIEQDPLAGLMFTDFIGASINAKDSRLRAALVPDLIASLSLNWSRDPSQTALAVLMLANATRLGETRQAKWAHFDGITWHIPQATAKTRVSHSLPLTAQMLAFLERYRQWQRSTGYDGAYLFPGKRTRKPITERQASEQFARLGAGEWTSHDLRKVGASTLLDLGVDNLIIDLLLNHKVKGVNQAYIHTHAEERKRDALERWHSWLDDRGFSALGR
jgi:integrase